jgi:hypothetical protein
MSVIAVCQTAALIIRQIQNQHNIIVIGTLVTAFIPFACILFWACKAMVMQIHQLFTIRPNTWWVSASPTKQQGLIQQERNKYEQVFVNARRATTHSDISE